MSNAIPVLTRSEISTLSFRTSFDPNMIKTLYKHYKRIRMLGIDDRPPKTDREDFMADFHLRESAAVARMWNEFDKNNSDVISFNDYVIGVSCLISKGTPQMKLQFAFQAVDYDGDGLITREELMNILQFHVKVIVPEGENEENIRNKMYTWVKKFFAITDKDQDGKIDCTETVAMLGQNSSIIDNFDINLQMLMKQFEKRDQKRIEDGLEKPIEGESKADV